MHSIIDGSEFFTLSASLHYQLSATPVNWRAIVALCLGDRMAGPDEELVVSALEWLNDGYAQVKRRLGPAAVLHPIRAMALLVRALERPSLLDVLTSLLHDKQEDILPSRYESSTWRKLEAGFQNLLRRVDPELGWFLNERIDLLAIKPGERYYQYLGRLLAHARQTPELARIKLADRLDNTLDLRMDLPESDPLPDAYPYIFAALYTDHPPRPVLRRPHPIAGKINGSRRLYQLFKNAVFLSLLRRADLPADPAATKLFHSLAKASLSEAERNLTHIFAYHITDPRLQRSILREVMGYCNEGCISQLTDAGSGHRLDGLFKRRFDHQDKAIRDRHLDDLYTDKTLMAEVATVFMAIFSSFIHDPDYRIHGIGPEGLHLELGD